MLLINLLAPEQRKEHALLLLFGRVKLIMEIAFLAASIVAIAALGIKIFLVGVVLNTTSTTGAPPQARELERNIRELNESLAVLERLDAETTEWSRVLRVITTSASIGVHITDLRITNTPRPHVTMRGTATTRAALLTWKTTLEGLSVIDHLSFPIANLLAPRDSAWELEADLALSRLTIDAQTTP